MNDDDWAGQRESVPDDRRCVGVSRAAAMLLLRMKKIGGSVKTRSREDGYRIEFPNDIAVSIAVNHNTD